METKQKNKSITTIQEALAKVQKNDTKISAVTFEKNGAKNTSVYYPKDHRPSINTLNCL